MSADRLMFTTRFVRAEDLIVGDEARADSSYAFFPVEDISHPTNSPKRVVHVVFDRLPPHIAWFEYEPDALIEIVVPA